jgi:L,D-peptidoglycan transpeptidase YkuD (ErfK/YbiS/YcfS/YnhG family)
MKNRFIAPPVATTDASCLFVLEDEAEWTTNKSSVVRSLSSFLYSPKSGKNGGMEYILKVIIQSPDFPTFLGKGGHQPQNQKGGTRGRPMTCYSFLIAYSKISN